MLSLIIIYLRLFCKYPNKALQEATIKWRYLKKLIFNYRNVIDIVKLYKVLESRSHLK